ncbi:hypothetical protein ABK040_005440 [Willaertia magna]
MSCFCFRRKGLSNTVKKKLYKKEKEISEIFGAIKVEMFIVNQKDELIYNSELISYISTFVDKESIMHYIHHLKATVLQFSKHINNEEVFYNSLHIKGSQTIFSLYSSSNGLFDIACYSKFSSELNVDKLHLHDIDNRMNSVLYNISEILDDDGVE